MTEEGKQPEDPKREGELPPEPVETPPAAEETPKFTDEAPPKTREEWDSLKESDPTLWTELTLKNMSKMKNENKELKEKFQQAEQQKNNLSVELESYKKQQTPDVQVTPEDGKKLPYSIHNLPKTKKEWEDLAIDDPVLFSDLRRDYTNSVQTEQQNFEQAQDSSRKVVQEEHPDMYVQELDESGAPILGEDGKPKLKIHPETGEPIFNEESEKGKIWVQIYNENPSIGMNPKAPELMMATMERRMRAKGQKIVDEAGQREQQVQEGQVVPEGVTPPAPVDVKFSSEEEKRHADMMIKNRVYANYEEYVKNRDSDTEGIYDENRMPTFEKSKQT